MASEPIVPDARWGDCVKQFFENFKIFAATNRKSAKWGLTQVRLNSIMALVREV